MFILSILSAFAISASAEPTIHDIHRLIDQLHHAVDKGQPTLQELVALESMISDRIDSLAKRPSRLACFKNSSGRYYPTLLPVGEIVGDTSYSAGHALQAECKATLPSYLGGIACFRRDNGRYYPSQSLTGEIIGSNDFAAGYALLNDCLKSLQ